MNITVIFVGDDSPVYLAFKYQHLIKSFIAINLCTTKKKMNYEGFQQLHSCLGAIPIETGTVKKQYDIFDTYWLQWMQLFNREADRPMTNECKVEENPAYTYHASQCLPPNVKQQCEKIEEESHHKTEPFEVFFQRRAISLSQKKILSQEERDELLKYRAFRMKNYLFKKGYRNFDKKIVYATRKKVADRRIRFQGKFINEYQAMELLGLTGQQHTFDELKEMMKALNKN